jgi:hypothetical protein
MQSVKEFMEFLNRERQSRRQQVIEETGKDPKTGLSSRRMVLSEKTRTRGGSKSRRRTARVWEPAE